MLGHSRSKNGVAPLAYVPGIHALLLADEKDVDGRDKAGHDQERAVVRHGQCDTS
jgi:hypothetical protein